MPVVQHSMLNAICVIEGTGIICCMVCYAEKILARLLHKTSSNVQTLNKSMLC